MQARNKIPSNTNKKDDGYLFDDRGETEYTTVEALKGYMLSELKKISQIKVDYETQGYFDSDPGDTFSLEDSVYYNPPLYLEARVYEQTESLVLGVTSSDRTTFTNFVQKESEISNDLLARMRKLIEANKVFTNEIITSDGVTFKNGFGSTTLTARVRDGIKDVTDTFSLKWYKDGTLFSNTKTVTINAADIEEKAVFRFDVADDSGNVRGGAEVTVTNIDDGKKGEPGKSPIITINDDSSLTIEDDEGVKQTEPLKGDSGKGVAAEEISYSISQDGTTPPTSGWSGTRPTPKAGWYMWTRTRFKYTDNTYSAYFYLVAQQGKDAIIISATPPTNPAKEDLWQDPNDATSTVYKWDGTKWIHWGISIDNLIASNVQIENGVFKRVEGTVIVGSKFVNSFSYTDGGVTYTGSTTVEDGNVIIARTGSDGSTWKTSLDRSLGFQDTYKASATAPARTTQLGQGKLYMVESGVGGYLPAGALNPVAWANISLTSGYVTKENATPQYRAIMRLDGSMALEIRGRCGPSAGFFTPGTGTKIGTLPAQYAPTRLAMFPVAFSGGFVGRIQIELNGDMIVQVNQESRNTVMLDGIVLPL